MDNRPIGVFDSGLGGLTVIREIIENMPKESIVYFGDSGRAPYGIKSRETIIKYALQDINFLLCNGIKMVVIACNTASACSLEIVKNNFDVPIVEVVEPGATACVRSTKNKKVGIIGTAATINSGVYERAINKIDKEIKVFSQACPLFVPLVEEGTAWWESEVAYMVADEYLTPLKQDGIDTLVLGCTHYPLLKTVISKVMGSDVTLISSALEVAKIVKETIKNNDLCADGEGNPFYKFYTSDAAEKFIPMCNSILNLNGKECSFMKIDIENY